eukprot:TRINITY_DN6492_c0_g1_i1.p1 TRINITY_DN6492_c0_g1~~TRINITY_DN6492_c0_g1_i1.p1  ORF type:complete len:257 (-),score=70.76 TRINITY_DN6492_c0_g1_i1:556-1326(-)
MSHAFPNDPPKVYLGAAVAHRLVDPATKEVNYSSIYQWNASFNSRLISLMQALHLHFHSDPPKSDPRLEEMARLLNKVGEREFNALLNLNVSYLVQQLSPEKLQAMSSSGNYVEAYANTVEFKTLLNYLEELMTYNEKLAQTNLQKLSEIETLKGQLQEKAAKFNELRKHYLDNIDKLNLIKERFDKAKVLSLLEQEIQSLEERSSLEEYLSPTLSSVIGQPNVADQGQFAQKCMEFLEVRKSYYKNVIKRDKLLE